METPVLFTTSIDCCRLFMNSNSGMPLHRINPMVGDLFRVNQDSKLQIWMKVLSRKWLLTNGSTPELIVSLGLPDGYTIPEFEEEMRKNHFPVR